jgi:hypothetical protein
MNAKKTPEETIHQVFPYRSGHAVLQKATPELLKGFQDAPKDEFQLT